MKKQSQQRLGSNFIFEDISGSKKKKNLWRFCFSLPLKLLLTMREFIDTSSKNLFVIFVFVYFISLSFVCYSMSECLWGFGVDVDEACSHYAFINIWKSFCGDNDSVFHSNKCCLSSLASWKQQIWARTQNTLYWASSKVNLMGQV